MASPSLGLAEAHERSVAELLHFFRFKRGQSVRAVEGTFEGVVESRLLEDTFTCECVCVHVCV